MMMPARGMPMIQSAAQKVSCSRRYRLALSMRVLLSTALCRGHGAGVSPQICVYSGDCTRGLVQPWWWCFQQSG